MNVLKESDRIAAGLLKLRAEGPFVVGFDVSGSSQADVIRWASGDIAAALVSLGQRAATLMTFSEKVEAEEPNVALELLLDLAVDRLFEASRLRSSTELAPFLARARGLGAKTVIVFSDCEFTPGDGVREAKGLKVLFVKYPGNAQVTGASFGLTIPYMR